MKECLNSWSSYKCAMNSLLKKLSIMVKKDIYLLHLDPVLICYKFPWSLTIIKRYYFELFKQEETWKNGM